MDYYWLQVLYSSVLVLLDRVGCDSTFLFPPQEESPSRSGRLAWADIPELALSERHNLSNLPPKLVMAAPLSKSEIIGQLEERRPGSTSGSYEVPAADNIAEWFRQFNQDLTECDIPSAQHQEAAFTVLPGTIRIEMMKQRRQGPCNWDVFKEVIVDAIIRMY